MMQSELRFKFLASMLHNVVAEADAILHYLENDEVSQQTRIVRSELVKILKNTHRDMRQNWDKQAGKSRCQEILTELEPLVESLHTLSETAIQTSSTEHVQEVKEAAEYARRALREFSEWHLVR